MENLAHKLNYNMRDKDGKLAPVAFVPHNFGGGMVEPTEAERQERERLAAERQTVESLKATETPVGEVSAPEIPPPIVRGFEGDCTEFPDEMLTDIDVEKVISHLKNSGPEVCQSPPCFFDRQVTMSL
jgi:pyroglutamyl-peptidase